MAQKILVTLCKMLIEYLGRISNTEDIDRRLLTYMMTDKYDPDL
jgi:hypothetical protein